MFAGWIRARVTLGGEDDGDGVAWFEVDGNGIEVVLSAGLDKVRKRVRRGDGDLRGEWRRNQCCRPRGGGGLLFQGRRSGRCTRGPWGLKG